MSGSDPSVAPDRMDDQEWIARAEAIAASKGLQLTRLRREVLELVASARAPLSAYAVLDQLSKTQGKAVGPPTAYRALDFLVDHGFALKIASRNAYARCDHLGHHHHGVLLICTNCGSVQEREAPALDDEVRRLTVDAGFSATRRTIEIEGLCGNCTPG